MYIYDTHVTLAMEDRRAMAVALPLLANNNLLMVNRTAPRPCRSALESQQTKSPHVARPKILEQDQMDGMLWLEGEKH